MLGAWCLVLVDLLRRFLPFCLPLVWTRLLLFLSSTSLPPCPSSPPSQTRPIWLWLHCLLPPWSRGTSLLGSHLFLPTAVLPHPPFPFHPFTHSPHSLTLSSTHVHIPYPYPRPHQRAPASTSLLASRIQGPSHTHSHTFSPRPRFCRTYLRKVSVSWVASGPRPPRWTSSPGSPSAQHMDRSLRLSCDDLLPVGPLASPRSREGPRHISTHILPPRH